MGLVAADPLSVAVALTDVSNGFAFKFKSLIDKGYVCIRLDKGPELWVGYGYAVQAIGHWWKLCGRANLGPDNAWQITSPAAGGLLQANQFQAHL